MDASLPPGRPSPGSRLSVATRQATARNPAAGRLLAAIVSSRSISTSLILFKATSQARPPLERRIVLPQGNTDKINACTSDSDGNATATARETKT